MGTYLVIGVVSGAIYGLAALGLVLIYKGSRVFNFAQGEFGTLAMYMLFYATEVWKWNYALGVVLALLAGGALGLATQFFVVRPLEDAPKVIALVGTAGVAFLAIGLELFFFGPVPKGVQPAIEGNGPTLFGYIVSNQKLLSLGVLIAVAGLAALFFQKTASGTAILANSQDSFAARVVGANVNRLSGLTWTIAGVLGALAGVLLGPELTFTPGYLTLTILIPAFTAGIVGGMTSLAGAFVAGQIIGIIEGLGLYFIQKVPSLAHLPEPTTILVFLFLVVALLIRPQGLFGSGA